MRPSRIVVYASVLLFLLTTGEARAAPVQPPGRVSRQDYKRYQQHVARIERIARRSGDCRPD